MAAQMGGQPVYILQEGTQRFTGRDARRMNITAGKVVAEAVKSTLGPKGMDKMLVDSSGDILITNDGAAILKEVEVKHPAAKMMVEIAKTVETEVGDGTTSSVVLAGELLKKAEDLLDQDIHATVIARGYRMAEEEGVNILSKISKKVDPADEAILEKVALTALNSKASGITAREHLAKLAVQAVKKVAEKSDGTFNVDKANIKIQKVVGGSTRDSELVEGIVIDKEIAHSGMPRVVKNAKIAILNTELKVKKTETDAKFNITSPEQVKKFMDEEEETVKNMVKAIAATGANCVLCQKDIEVLAQYYLAKENILAVKSISEKDIKLISRATGGKIITNIKDISSKDLGKAGKVEGKKIGGKEFVFIEDCENPKALTVLLKGGSEHVVDESERSMDDAISVVKDVAEDGTVLPGGGAALMEVSMRLKDFSNTISGREQLAVLEFANALEKIPRTIAENAGLDPIDTIIALRASHEKGGLEEGIDLATGEPRNMYELGIVEPGKMVKQVIRSATEAAIMILRIDDVIAAKGSLGEEEEEKKESELPKGRKRPQMPSY
jgi:thermosome